MSGEPLVSLRMCLKNGMPYLPEAIASVAAQSYRRFELVIQDGGSTDGSLEYLQSVNDIPDIRVDSRPDYGIGQAANRAVQRCKGEIIGSIACDDLLEPEALEVAVEAFSSHPDWAAIYGVGHLIALTGEIISTHKPAPFDLVDFLQQNSVPPFSTAFFSKKVCGDDLRFDESMKTCGDFDLWLRLSHLTIVALPRVLARIRIGDSSMTCRPENYHQFCADKIDAVDRFLALFGHSSLPDRIWHDAVCGIYLWAAQSIYNLEGRSDRFDLFCHKVEEFMLHSIKYHNLMFHVDSCERAKAEGNTLRPVSLEA